MIQTHIHKKQNLNVCEQIQRMNKQASKENDNYNYIIINVKLKVWKKMSKKTKKH